MTSTLAGAPAATAQSTAPPSPAPAVSDPPPAPEEGSVEITATGPGGDALPGAAFTLLDSAGKEAGRATSDAQGRLSFPGLPPGIYRLKETASGSPLHAAVDDRDVVVTPGTATKLTLAHPFRAAPFLLKAKDSKSGRLLPGSTVNIGSGTSTLLTLTTGPQGTATAQLPMSSRTASLWVRQVKAPAGYDLYRPSTKFTATPGSPVTVTLTNTRTAPTLPPDPTGRPTTAPSPEPTTEPPTGKPSNGAHSPPGRTTPGTGAPTTPSAKDASLPLPPAAHGSLARTGADATAWAIGGGLLLAAGGGTVLATRHRRATEPAHAKRRNSH
ncbi:collagen binding domain-containing protein [Streptomyces sp. NPDC004111]|uniref:MSCRAMM family protein n=1 Tax=Streptomyces sp. NPDC004111 TaxID=3364690 RepID=UPI00368AD372